MASELDRNEFSMDQKEFIDGGSYGQVYKLLWETKKMNVAAKHFNGSESTITKEFEKEVKNLLRVNHPNIIKLYGTIKDKDFKPYIVMEYADCGSLYDCIKTESRKQLSYLALHHLMLQLAKAVVYLHDLNPIVIHRDLKPQNLLLTNNYRTLKICDFGTLRELASNMTQERGTAIYTAPEVFQGKKYTEKCDVFSVGIILWQVFSKEEPTHDLENTKYITIVNLVCNHGRRPDLEKVKDFRNRKTIISLIEQCWAKEPSRRPPMKMLEIVLSMNPFSSLPETTDADYI